MKTDLPTEQGPQPILSLCISTINRAEFLRETLETILRQVTDECEVLIVDNASTDNTPHVVAELARRCASLRYIRTDSNNGLDSNFDRAVELSRGEYCWLTSDDDLLKPGAIAAVLRAVRHDPSAVLVNYEFRDFTMSRVVQDRVLDLDADRTYGPWESERMFVELGDSVRYIGSLVMKRAVWLSRQRNLYIGSYYGFVGMLYQERLPRQVHVIAQPCVSYRIGNAVEFDKQLPEIIFAKWPSLVASLPFSYRSRRTLHSSEPWKHLYEMLVWRGTGVYSRETYRRWVKPSLHRARDRLVPASCALLPCFVVRLGLIAYLSVRSGRLRQLDGLYLAHLKLRNSVQLRRLIPGAKQLRKLSAH